jgi:hypothetical protein
MEIEFTRIAPCASLQVDKAAADLKNTNVRLKDTVNQVIELHLNKV